ncbi:MAG TPA: glycosyltransferase family A protein [Anaerolineae bacterium]|nr:glycosyltransferase family A protein [Anaerolineae bacterium]
MDNIPRVTFGVIVLNGEPFTRYCLRALYPFAHEIIVVEGAVSAAAAAATPDGHSTDGTLGVLERFKSEEDSQGKVQIVASEGYWGEKDDQSQAYAERATGDYLWQVDIDEFYQPEDMSVILDMLRDDPEISAVSFKQIALWGGFDYVTDGWYLRQGGDTFHRLFKWGPGYRYATHRPPTVHDSLGRDLRGLRYVSGHELAQRGIVLYHYGLVFPKQVLDKCRYYDRASWVSRNQYYAWAQSNYLRLGNPFRVHNVYDHPSWLERFVGEHPPQIEAMRRDMRRGRLEVETREVDDIERLLASPSYKLGCLGLRVLEPVNRRSRGAWSMVRLLVGKLLRWVHRPASPIVGS